MKLPLLVFLEYIKIDQAQAKQRFSFLIFSSIDLESVQTPESRSISHLSSSKGQYVCSSSLRLVHSRIHYQRPLLLQVSRRARWHFRWRGLSIHLSMYVSSSSPSSYQTNIPGANVNQTSFTNRTIWPLDGGSLSLDLHHPWTYVFVNLGLGTTTSTFNISLTPNFYNVTGNGTFCLPKLMLPAGTTVVDGQNASIQVVTSGRSGSALYNVS